MSDDLIERLRANGLGECDEAIARIEALESQVRAADALAATCLDLSQQAYGYDHVYETTFHREVYEALHTALAAYRATKEGGE